MSQLKASLLMIMSLPRCLTNKKQWMNNTTKNALKASEPQSAAPKEVLLKVAPFQIKSKEINLTIWGI